MNPDPGGQEGLADVRALKAIAKAADTDWLQAIGSPSRMCSPSPDLARLAARSPRRLELKRTIWRSHWLAKEINLFSP